ncbi:hypothetical protein ECEC1862_0861, partial [Escherichia coli EC1862]
MHTAPRLLFISSASRWAFSGFWITERPGNTQPRF